MFGQLRVICDPSHTDRATGPGLDQVAVHRASVATDEEGVAEVMCGGDERDDGGGFGFSRDGRGTHTGHIYIYNINVDEINCNKSEFATCPGERAVIPTTPIFFLMDIKRRTYIVHHITIMSKQRILETALVKNMTRMEDPERQFMTDLRDALDRKIIEYDAKRADASATPHQFRATIPIEMGYAARGEQQPTSWSQTEGIFDLVQRMIETGRKRMIELTQESGNTDDEYAHDYQRSPRYLTERKPARRNRTSEPQQSRPQGDYGRHQRYGEEWYMDEKHEPEERERERYEPDEQKPIRGGNSVSQLQARHKALQRSREQGPDRTDIDPNWIENINCIIFVIDGCQHCTDALNFLNEIKAKFTTVRIAPGAVTTALDNKSGEYTKFPRIFIAKQFIGGFDKLKMISPELRESIQQ